MDDPQLIPSVEHEAPRLGGLESFVRLVGNGLHFDRILSAAAKRLQANGGDAFEIAFGAAIAEFRRLETDRRVSPSGSPLLEKYYGLSLEARIAIALIVVARRPYRLCAQAMGASESEFRKVLEDARKAMLAK